MFSSISWRTSLKQHQWAVMVTTQRDESCFPPAQISESFQMVRNAQVTLLFKMYMHGTALSGNHGSLLGWLKRADMEIQTNQGRRSLPLLLGMDPQIWLPTYGCRR